MVCESLQVKLDQVYRQDSAASTCQTVCGCLPARAPGRLMLSHGHVPSVSPRVSESSTISVSAKELQHRQTRRYIHCQFRSLKRHISPRNKTKSLATHTYPSSNTMSSNRTRRVAKEVADIHSDTLSKIEVETLGGGDDLTHLRGKFNGPPDTPYEGGKYAVDIRIPSEYPFRPPVMKFETRIWHPNVSSQTVSMC